VRIRAIIASCGLDAVQLHGDEPPRTASCPCRVIKGTATSCCRPGGPGAYPVAACWLMRRCRAVRRHRQRADWELAAVLAARQRVILAGGLTPANVAAAVRQVRPYAVDVASVSNQHRGARIRTWSPSSSAWPRRPVVHDPATRSRGHFGQFGGRYVAETLMPALLELEQAYRAAQADPCSTANSTATARLRGPPQSLYLASG